MTSGEETPIPDLSALHELVGPWFRSSTAIPLGDHRAALERDGFVGPIPVLDADGLAAVRAAVDRVMGDLDRFAPHLYEVERGHRERPEEVVCHFLGGWRVEPALHDLVWHPGIAGLAAALLGVEQLRFWHDQVFAKPAHHPGVVPWHQDYAYWTRTEPACHITVHIALDEADQDNGCLHYVPGSHRWGLMPPVPFDGAVDAVRERVPAGVSWCEEPMKLRAGEAVFHHSHVLHGSYGNRSPRPRRAAVLNYMGADVRSASAAPLLRGATAVPPGAVVEGPCFPLVWPPQQPLLARRP